MKDPILDFFERNKFLEEPEEIHLQESPLCDFREMSLDRLQKELFSGTKSPSRICEKAYDFIRKKILYAFDAWDVKASETYAKGTGMGFNKTNLMIALLRAWGIPSVYTAFWIRKAGFFSTTAPEMFEKITPMTLHVYTEAYLSPRIGWRRFVDTSLDPRLRQALESQGYRSQQHMVLERPIQRFPTAEAVIEWRKRYKEEMGIQRVIYVREMEMSNRRLEELRSQVG